MDIMKLTASALLCLSLAACGSQVTRGSSSEALPQSSEASSEAVTEKPSRASRQPVKGNTPEDIEKSVAAASGEAYLSINEGSGWIQYTGINNDPAHTMLTYNAKTAAITGNGTYTVGVTADTKGYRFDTTGNENDASVLPAGLLFAAAIIKDGSKTVPGAVITIDTVKVNGQDIPLTAKNYTSSDDGIELRSNIYNQWTSGRIPRDAVSAEGALVIDGSPNPIAADYSSCIVDPAYFSQWTAVDVTFTVTGLDH